MPPIDAIHMQFGESLRGARQNAGMTQETLALKAGYEKSYVGMIERGEKSPRLETIGKLANALGISIDSLFTPLESDEALISKLVSSVRILNSRGQNTVAEKLADLATELARGG
jgi:transcriptional regulator with XRE-family HTH domain